MAKAGFRPDKAFILAAGFGTRMRPITDRMPKPMVEIGGRSLIYHTLDKLALAGVRDVMVNMHYKADILQNHLDQYPQQRLKIHTSFEPEILDTAGGILKVLPFFEDKPFYVIAGDGYWTEGNIPSLERLAQGWDGERMDILTLMQPLEQMILTKGAGDYDLLPDGRVKRSLDKKGYAMWTNIRLNHPRLYLGLPQGPSSFLNIMDKCEAAGRFYAYDHDGEWHHISTPEDLARVEDALKNQAHQAGQ